MLLTSLGLRFNLISSRVVVFFFGSETYKFDTKQNKNRECRDAGWKGNFFSNCYLFLSKNMKLK